jgi:hypothetical protein
MAVKNFKICLNILPLSYFSGTIILNRKKWRILLVAMLNGFNSI